MTAPEKSIWARKFMESVGRFSAVNHFLFLTIFLPASKSLHLMYSKS